MQLWIWQGIGVELPDDWEMLQFSRDRETGRCAFADRYQFRLELGWRTIEGPPDFDRMLSDYVAKLKDEGTMTDARLIEVAGRRGIEGHLDATLTTRFSRYFAEPPRLVDAVLFWPDGIDEELQCHVLASLAIEPTWRGRFRRWKAFGMDLLASGGLSLTACKVQPASARMTFAKSADGKRPTEQFQRLGMVAHWLRGTVEQWLIAQTPKNVTMESPSACTVSEHHVTVAHGACAVSGIVRLLTKARHYRAAAWICPADGRLYSVACDGSESQNADSLDLAGGRLVCCEDLRLEAGVSE